MARKKKAKTAKPVPVEPTELNRYGAQGIYNETGVHCCCHMVPLTDICDGCELLRDTKRQPTLVGVDAVRMNSLNDDGVRVVARYEAAATSTRSPEKLIGEDE